MIFILITFNVAILFATWRIYGELCELRRTVSLDAFHTIADIRELKLARVNLDPLKGEVRSLEIKAAIAEKMADRAFNMASSANLGVVALQKALAVPRLMTKAQVQQNQLAKKGVDKLFTTSGNFDWLKPVLSDEELDLLEAAERTQAKADMDNTQ